MRWFRSTIEGAGLARFGAGPLFSALLASAGLAGFLTADAFRVPVLGAFVFLGIFAFQLEALSGLARARRNEVASLWPDVIDSIHSAVSSGMSLTDAFDELAISSPIRIRSSFARLSSRLDLGWSMSDGLEGLKSEFGEVHADRLCELLYLVSSSGSESLLSSLRQQSKNLRRDIAQKAEIASKQGWVSATAKIAISAPWIVVALLSIRQENAAVYNSSSGAAILVLGFVVSVFAYRLMHFLGALPEEPRIFSS